jgi:hypothetical protein
MQSQFHNCWVFFFVFISDERINNVVSNLTLISSFHFTDEIYHVEAVLGKATTLPCDVETKDRQKTVYTVLWFRQSNRKPIYRWVNAWPGLLFSLLPLRRGFRIAVHVYVCNDSDLIFPDEKHNLNTTYFLVFTCLMYYCTVQNHLRAWRVLFIRAHTSAQLLLLLSSSLLQCSKWKFSFLFPNQFAEMEFILHRMYTQYRAHIFFSFSTSQRVNCTEQIYTYCAHVSSTAGSP